MTTLISKRAIAPALSLSLLLAACGGGGDGQPTGASTTSSTSARVLKGGGGTCTGSCTGGGGTPVAGVNALPTTAPAPDVVVRESFGAGPNRVRPKGGKGDLRSSDLHTSIDGFWVEWPNNKNVAWTAPNSDQTWKFCGTAPTPYELPSPLQGDENNGFFGAGCASSELDDVVLPLTQWPTALLPFSPPAGTWEVSMEGWPSAVPGAYVALGLTSSAATVNNFSTAGQVWLGLSNDGTGAMVYELRLNGRSGALLASGVAEDMTWNHMVIRYDPVAQTLSASLNNQSLGSFATRLATPKYAGFEGVGIMDNFVIRRIAAVTP